MRKPAGLRPGKLQFSANVFLQENDSTQKSDHLTG
jgi:hypothetical protein